MMVKLQVRPVRVCKTHFDLQDQRRIAPVGPSLPELEWRAFFHQRWTTYSLPESCRLGQLANQKIVKIENRNELTYKNLNQNMIQNLRRRLNRVPSSSEFGAEVRQTRPGVSTPCKFLSGYQSLGRCTEVRSCRVGNIEYQNNVSRIEGLGSHCVLLG